METLKVASQSAQLDPGLQELCEANGFPTSKALHSPKLVTKLEMFMFNFDHMSCLAHFPYLRELTLVQQNIVRITGLQSCRVLERMWLCETPLTRISGLDHCISLRRLYLCNNKLTEISGLAHLANLNVLWLNHNQISSLAGLSTLSNLQELSVACNSLTTLDGLDDLRSLERLLIAGNDIGSIRQVLRLCPLARLRALAFADPHFGDNPIAQLCNYHTYVLYHLPELEQLDAVRTTPETRAAARTTFEKKKMYYHMRVQHLHAIGDRYEERAVALVAQAREDLMAALSTAARASLDLQSRCAGHPSGADGDGGSDDVDTAAAARQAKAHSLSAVIAKVYQACERQQHQLEQFRRHLRHAVDADVARVLLELETGGNVRVEHGNLRDDVWARSCIDLVRARFFSADFRSFGIRDIVVHRVTRLHNRWLRNRFESQLGQHVDTSDPSYKRFLEYLFLAGDQGASSSEQAMLQAAEHGTRDSEWGVPLSNSISIVDVPRISAWLQHGSNGSGTSTAPSKDGAPSEGATSNTGSSSGSLPRGCILINKVLLGRTKQLPSRPASALRPNTAPGSGQAPKPAGGIDRDAYGDCDAVYSSRAGDRKQRQWWVFDKTMVLPEYMVEFDYLYHNDSSAYAADVAAGMLLDEAEDVEDLEDASQDEQEDAAAASGGNVASDAATGRSSSATEVASLRRTQQRQTLASSTAVRLLRRLRADVRDGDIDWIRAARDASDLPPRTAAGNAARVFLLSEETVLRAAQVSGASLAHITRLDLHASGLTRLTGLPTMPQLQHLGLAFNELAGLDGMPDLPVLAVLDISFNAVVRLDGLRATSGSLRTLHAASNQIAALDEVNILRKYAPELGELDLLDNPVCDLDACRSAVLRRLPRLAQLNGVSVTRSERQDAARASTSITDDLILSNAASHCRARSDLQLNKLPAGMPGDKLEAVSQVRDLNLNGCQIRKLTNLDGLTHCVRASFASNSITRMPGVAVMQQLQQLSLARNRISRIAGLQALGQLQRLDLSHNMLTSVQGIEALADAGTLRVLILAGNSITTLQPLARVHSLVQLYAAGNKIAEQEEILALRASPHLVILDLSRNPVTRTEQYRAYAIYHVRHVKVLDSRSVDAEDAARAHEVFSGRLTTEDVTQVTGHRFFQHVNEVDLSRSRLRHVGILSQLNFAQLKVLNLESNALTSIRSLSNLPSLRVIRLGHNQLRDGGLCSFQGGSSGLCGQACGLASLPSLEALYLEHNQVSDMSSLHLWHAPQLTTLVLSHNDITHVTGLDYMTSLRELVLSKNKIKTIERGALDWCSSCIRELVLDDNALRTFSALSSSVYPQMHRLSASSNRISDLADLEPMKFPVLTTLNLASTSVARRKGYRAQVIRRLPATRVLDGRTVTQEEREKGDLAATLAMQQAFPPAQTPSGKVPVRVQAISFDSVIGYTTSDAVGASGAGDNEDGSPGIKASSVMMSSGSGSSSTPMALSSASLSSPSLSSSRASASIGNAKAVYLSRGRSGHNARGSTRSGLSGLAGRRRRSTALFPSSKSGTGFGAGSRAAAATTPYSAMKAGLVGSSSGGGSSSTASISGSSGGATQRASIAATGSSSRILVRRSLSHSSSAPGTSYASFSVRGVTRR